MQSAYKYGWTSESMKLETPEYIHAHVYVFICVNVCMREECVYVGDRELRIMSFQQLM